MLVDLIHVTTEDGLRLDGALQVPAERADPAGAVDAWLCLHGTGSNFYSSTLLAGLAPRLLALGAAVLRANTRGHDLISAAATSRGRQLQGAAFERVDQSPYDVAAWIRFLAERGFKKIGVLGHSLGAVKGIYSLAQPNPPQVAALVAVSPPRLSHSHFLSAARGEVFAETYAKAQQHLATGEPDALMQVTFPISYIASAAAYVDRYHTDERYNILHFVERLGVPTLATYGSKELQSDAAFTGMPEALAPLATPANALQVAVIGGADHLYTGVHDALADRIESWLRRLGRSR